MSGVQFDFFKNVFAGLEILEEEDKRLQAKETKALAKKQRATEWFDQQDYATAITFYEQAAKESTVPLTAAQCLENCSLAHLVANDVSGYV